MMFQRMIIAAASAFVLLIAGASAAEQTPLTENQAKRFVASLDSVDAMHERLEAEGKIDNLKIATKPKSGEAFKPYSKAVTALKDKYPADHARLAKIVKTHGFSAKDWADAGDRVMIAYMALKMQEEDPRTMQMMETMDKSMLDMVPPEMRAQLESTFAMMEAVKNVSEADKRAVAPVKAALDAYMDKNAEAG
jgi:hypothetical protein